MTNETLLGDQLKEAGIVRAEAAADPEWKIAAFDCVVLTARQLATFTADDVFERLNHTGETTHENRAFGHIMRAAARANVCRKVRAFPETEPSRRPELHRSPIQRWDSLLVGQAVAPVDNPYL